MCRKQSKYRQIIVLEARRDRVDPARPNPAQDAMRGQSPADSATRLPPYARRKFRGWIVTHFDVRRVQRLIPIKSENFRLRYRNLSYKRKWNLVWC